MSRDESEPGAILDDVARAFLWRYIAVLLGALALLPLLNSLAIYRLVRAIRQVSAEAGKIAPTNPQTRLNPAGLPSELIQLVRATNSLIDRLQQNSSAQREFIGNLVHELRTPLAALKMELDQIEDELSRSQIHRLLDRVSHVLSQIRDLADLETLEAGQRTTFDLIEVTEQTVAELAPSIFAAGDKISFDFQERPVLVSGQPILVGLALGNLISNASRHTPKGTNILVTVLPSGAVFVVDDGPGISRQTIERPRFRRADRARTDSAGLGLSIVQRIADVHGGKLDIQPRSGRGTRCEISFPLVADGLGAQASMPSALRSAG